MGVASKYNKGTGFTYQAKGDNIPFTNLEGLHNTDGDGVVYTLRSLYINHKSRYGDAPVAVIDGAFVNLPKHMTDTVQEMMNDDGFVQAVNIGAVGFMVRPYVRKENKAQTLYTVNWMDL